PSIMNVSFSSKDPNRAAEIANAIADTYIASTMENKLKSTKLVGQWLQDRITDLKTQSAAADRALQDYKVANNLVSTHKGLLDSDQISEWNSQLANARIATAQAKARFDAVNQSVGNAKQAAGANNPNNSIKSSVALNNSDILKLRAELRDVTAKVTE